MYKYRYLGPASLASALLIAGCGTPARTTQTQAQFCYLKTNTVVVRDAGGRVTDSKTHDVMQCSDNRLDHLLQTRTGMAPNCGVYTYWTQIGGRDVQRKGISCQRPDGSWEVVHVPGY